MTDAVKGVTAQPTRYEDGSYRRSRLSEMKAKMLREDQKARSVFQDEKAAEYQNDIPELTYRQAASFGKKTRQNETTAAIVDNRMVYVDKEKMEAAQKAMPEKTHVYLDPDKKYDNNVRGIIADNPEDFYVDGEFSSDQYKRRFGSYTGFDNKANLDEIAVASSDYGVGKRTIRRAMKRAGYEREKDLTWLYKSLAALGVLGATTATGAILGDKFTSNVWGIHNDGTPELLDKIITESNAAGRGALKGLLGGILPAVGAALLVKDNGGKDIFKGNTAEEIVAKGEKNIKTRIRGSKNQKMMKAILNMKNLSNEDKAIILKLAYGELTGKKVNDRELVAAYEIAKYCNEHPEINAAHYNDLPGKQNPATNTTDNNQESTSVTNQVNNSDNNTEHEEVISQTCELKVDGDDGSAIHKFTVRAGVKGKDKDGNNIVLGDNPYNIVMGKYKRADGKPMTHKDIMALRNHIFGKGKGVKAGNIDLLDKETVNGVEYKYVDGNVKLGRTANVKLKYNNPIQQSKENYGVYDCDGKPLAQNLSKAEANKKAAELAQQNPSKYVFTKVK